MIAAALLAAVTLGAAGCSAGHGTPVAPAVSATTLRQPATPAGSSSTAAAVLRSPHLSRSTPTRLQIPAIGVDTTLMALGLRADGSMQVPPGGFPAGWYTGGPTPGELGPAVIAGHIDMRGPGVFYALHNVLRGDRVTVTRSDGSLAVFSVTAVGQYPKNRFPTTLVYGQHRPRRAAADHLRWVVQQRVRPLRGRPGRVRRPRRAPPVATGLA